MVRPQGLGRIARAAITCVLTSALATPYVPAFADTSTSELEQEVARVQGRLAELMSTAEQCQYDLIDLKRNLSETEQRITALDAEIPQTAADLSVAQEELSKVVVESYKMGQISLIDIILSSTSFDNLISRITYANRVVEHEREVIDNTQSIADTLAQQRSNLETERANQVVLVAQTQDQLDTVTSAAAEIETYYNELSEELKAELEAKEAEAAAKAIEEAREAAAEAQRLADEEAARLAEEAARQSAPEEAPQTEPAPAPEAPAPTPAPAPAPAPAPEPTPAPAPSPAPAPTPAPAPAPAPAPTPTPAPEPTPAPPAPAPVPEPEVEPEPEPESKPEAEEEERVDEKGDEEKSEDEEKERAPRPEHTGSATALVAQAYSIIGAGYQWSGYTWTGEVDSSAFTCSGVVDFAMGLPTNSSTPEGLFEAVGSNLVTSVDALSYGDLVFYTYGGRYPGHVGIYVGGGQIIDSIPNGGVAVRDVDYMDFIGGGPIL